MNPEIEKQKADFRQAIADGAIDSLTKMMDEKPAAILPAGSKKLEPLRPPAKKKIVRSAIDELMYLQKEKEKE